MDQRVTMTVEELKAMEEILAPIKPSDYDLETYTILHNLYGRFITIRLHPRGPRKSRP